MADVATTPSTRPRAIPKTAGLSLDPPPSNSFQNNSLSASVQTRRSAHLNFPPVSLQGSYDYDRIIKSGQVLKRTRKTKSWKPIFVVLRPNLLSVYRDSSESRLRHQITLSDLTAVARQKDPRRRDKHVFALFSPSRNYHLEATSEDEAQDWVELIRQEARMDDIHEDELEMMSPGGATMNSYWGVERSIDAQLSPSQVAHDDRGGYSSSEVESWSARHPTHGGMSSASLPRQRDRGTTQTSTMSGPRRPSHLDYSGAEHGSFSDFSDTAVAGRMSALSLNQQPNDYPPVSYSPQTSHAIYGASPLPGRPSLGQRNPSQLSNINLPPPTTNTLHSPLSPSPSAQPQDTMRVIHQSHLYHLQKKSGPSIRSWKKVWMVLRATSLTLYKSSDEYAALLVLPLHTILDAVELDPMSKSKTACMMLITEEKNYRFACMDEDGLAKWLGAFMSVLRRRGNTGAPPSQAPGATGGNGVNAGAVAVS